MDENSISLLYFVYLLACIFQITREIDHPFNFLFDKLSTLILCHTIFNICIFMIDF